MDVLGCNAARIQSEYLERLQKIRFGMDRGWRPPGLMLKGGTAAQRAQALQRLQELARGDGFFCSYVRLGPGLQLRYTRRVSRVAIESAGVTPPISDPLVELQRLARSARKLGKNGWVLLVDNLDRFEGDARARAESYREIARWMGSMPEESYVGLLAVLAVTPEFESRVASPIRELAALRPELESTASRADHQLLAAADTGIRALEHEEIVRELLVLTW